MKQRKSDFTSTVAIGFMLFALFFGAGNLIFPVLMGQMAGTNVWSATFGFIVTGVGLPLLGVLAIGFSGKEDLYSMASRVHPIFGLVFTTVLYLTIGPFFAIPRTGTVSYEVGIKPLLGDTTSSTPLIIFTIIFFAITCIFSLKPGKIVDIVGKVLTPILLIVIAVLIGVAIFNPMGGFGAPNTKYTDASFFKGFQEGYLTMDTLAAFVFGIIVINAVRERGAVTKKQIMTNTLKSALIAAGLLAIIYAGLAYLGAASINEVGGLDNGGAILSAASSHYFGSYGRIILGVIVIAACLTTSIGLVTACSAYFNKLIPSVSYTTFAIVLSVFSTIVANVGLEKLIAFSVPVLVAIYPLAICLIVLTFLHRFFQGRSSVYIMSLALTFIVSFFDGLNAADYGVEAVNNIFSALPLYSVGLGWALPAVVGGILGYFMNFNSGKVTVTEQKTIN
ncbi:branched-chain amino acid transport system II carrier protein [Bacillus massiliigorillae]|uniref:branched-chain amino acid transport system II carrier protein n=1 Tax=Bacillus massiliigorillae TaxID=1243664 RepID=UPI00039FDCF0|nr:branched-chain amino acid transport system II carrier protein [Bacillus massiliigorillae]